MSQTEGYYWASMAPEQIDKNTDMTCYFMLRALFEQNNEIIELLKRRKR